LTAVAWKRTLCAAQWVRNASLWVASWPTRSERSRSWGSRPVAQRRYALWRDADGRHQRRLGSAHVKDSGRRTPRGAIAPGCHSDRAAAR